MAPVRIFYDFAKSLGQGRVTLLGDGTRVQVLSGAMANAISAMALDLGDVHRGAFFHASAGIVPAVFAVAEDREDISGREVLLGTALGIETGIRVALTVNPELRLRGLDTTSQCGVFGAAVGSIKMLKPNQEKILHALALAGTQACGELQYLQDGDWSKCLHPGKAASDGVLAAYLADRGYIGPHNILEGRYGFPMALAGAFHREQIVRGLGTEWRILELGLKIHAACRFSNAAIDGTLEILGEHSFSPQDVERVRIRMGKMGVEQLGNRIIKNFYDGQMSAPFLVAVALLKGRVNYRDVMEGLEDEGVHQTMKRVEMAVDPEIPDTARNTIVEVMLTDGKRFATRVDLPRGEPEIPLKQEELEKKFLSLAEASLQGDSARILMERILHLEDTEHIRDLWLMT